MNHLRIPNDCHRTCRPDLMESSSNLPTGREEKKINLSEVTVLKRNSKLKAPYFLYCPKNVINTFIVILISFYLMDQPLSVFNKKGHKHTRHIQPP